MIYKHNYNKFEKDKDESALYDEMLLNELAELDESHQDIYHDKYQLQDKEKN